MVGDVPRASDGGGTWHERRRDTCHLLRSIKDYVLSNRFTYSSLPDRIIMSPAPQITLSILRRYYPFVIDLRTYLTHLLQSSPSPESSSYTSLLNTAYVASSQPPNNSFSYFPPDLDMREVGRVLASYLNSYK